MNNLGHVYVCTGEMVPFEGVHLNEGGAYNQTDSTSIFPLDGAYLFTVSLHSGNLLPQNSIEVSLMLDGSTLAAVDHTNTMKTLFECNVPTLQSLGAVKDKRC